MDYSLLNSHLVGLAEHVLLALQEPQVQALAEPFHSMLLKVFGEEPVTIMDAYTGRIEFESGGVEYGLRIRESTIKSIRYTLFRSVPSVRLYEGTPLEGYGSEVRHLPRARRTSWSIIFSKSSVEEAVAITNGILAGLNYLHRVGLTHRDMKPENVLLQDGIPRLTDFGLARVLKTEAQTGDISGTPRYMAPETTCTRLTTSDLAKV
jgi:hypothetical protein